VAPAAPAAGYGSPPALASGGYGASPAPPPAVRGYGASPVSPPAVGGYGSSAPATGGYGSAPSAQPASYGGSQASGVRPVARQGLNAISPDLLQRLLSGLQNNQNGQSDSGRPASEGQATCGKICKCIVAHCPHAYSTCFSSRSMGIGAECGRRRCNHVPT
jgi:hypothetical protein